MPGGVMPCSAAAASPRSEPAARLQGYAPLRILMVTFAAASACPALGKHAPAAAVSPRAQPAAYLQNCMLLEVDRFQL